tara:strand:+ start:358 stop:786 length:429 start_codon:yes stop_codon:yes gene_type:complete
MTTVPYEVEVSERLVGSAVFNTVGTDELRPAGSIPVHLRLSLFTASANPSVTGTASDPHLVETIRKWKSMFAGHTKCVAKFCHRETIWVGRPEHLENRFKASDDINMEVDIIVAHQHTETDESSSNLSIAHLDRAGGDSLGK